MYAIRSYYETIDITFPKARWLDVRVTETGKGPVSGATVWVAPKQGDDLGRVFDGLFGASSKGRTDAQGKARIGPLPEGTLEVHARAAGFLEALQDVRITSYNVCYTKLLRIPGAGPD